MERPARTRALVLVTACTFLVLPHAGAAPEDNAVDALLYQYLAERGARPQIAPTAQLARRYAIDLTGVLPTAADLEQCQGLAPAAMFDYFRDKAPMAHSEEERPYVWSMLLRDADRFLFSNSSQFSQVAHVRELRDQLRRVYAEGWSFQAFARWALTSQAFLNRFPSGADRANAAFFVFLGRDSFASEVPVGNAWNGYRLRDPELPANQAESNPDYHVYDLDPARCASGAVVCTATLWAQRITSLEQAITTIVESPLFAEATVNAYWERLVGRPLPGNDFPELRRALVQGLRAHDFDVNWLVREIATSVAYAQEMGFR